jgi:nucleotide-binding universal stress UspA family protein
MAAPRKILVGVDGSSRALDVAVAAGRLARSVGASLTLARIVPVPIEGLTGWDAGPSASFLDLLEQEATESLGKLAHRIPPGVPVERRVELGKPWRSLCAIARELDVDLILIGSHGYDTLDRVLGTTAARVVDHADRSVLVVRSPLPFEPGES